MLLRLAVIVAVVLAFLELCTVRVTLPALQLVGLVAWAVSASVAALVLWRRTRSHPIAKYASRSVIPPGPANPTHKETNETR
jgi:hypothetical protein